MDLRRRLSPRALARQLLRLAHDDRGATAVEYGLILALVVLAVIGSIQALANTTIGMWNDVSTKVQNAR